MGIKEIFEDMNRRLNAYHELCDRQMYNADERNQELNDKGYCYAQFVTVEELINKYEPLYANR